MFSPHISRFTAAVLGFLIAFVRLSPAADPTPPGDVRKAIERSTAFLEKEGVTWMKKQKCASCHHIPMMVWALTEARLRNYPVNEKVLGEVTAWALAEKNHAEVFQDVPLDTSKNEKDYLGPLLMSLAVGANKDRDQVAEQARQRLLTLSISQQEKDGSWNANSGGRPPVHATRDVQTSWALLALPEREGAWKTQREAAEGWLSKHPPADGVQGIAMRLLLYQRLGKTAVDAAPLVENLLKLQNQDGGWSQTKRMKSDAFATGLALYVLSSQKGAEEAISRGQAFLVKSQQPEGSWAMVSRPAEPAGPGPARNIGPIRYFGTAWATLGLVRSGPVNEPAKK